MPRQTMPRQTMADGENVLSTDFDVDSWPTAILVHQTLNTQFVFNRESAHFEGTNMKKKLLKTFAVGAVQGGNFGIEKACLRQASRRR